jgi:hypothetical protein
VAAKSPFFLFENVSYIAYESWKKKKKVSFFTVLNLNL